MYQVGDFDYDELSGSQSYLGPSNPLYTPLWTSYYININSPGSPSATMRVYH